MVGVAFHLKGRRADEQKEAHRRSSWENRVGTWPGWGEDRQETRARGPEDGLEGEGRCSWKQVAGPSPRNSVAL